jgi:hypothetical protein
MLLDPLLPIGPHPTPDPRPPAPPPPQPGNFMLLDDSERSPLKAIDFGLAVPFDPEGLPRSDLGFEGTPW